MKRSKIYLLASLIISLLVSCETDYPMNLDSSYTRLIVYGMITTDTTAHEVRLTKSADYFSNTAATPITTAKVVISDGEKEFPLSCTNLEKGIYTTASNVYGLVGKTYTLKITDVDIDGDGTTEEYTASSELKAVAKSDSIMVVYQEPIGGSKDERYNVKLYAKDPADSKDFYMFRTRINGTLIDSLYEVTTSNDILFNGEELGGVTVARLDQKNDDQKIKVGDVVSIETLGITKEYYDFIVALQTESGISIPMFSGTPSNIPTNIVNKKKTVGFFAACSIDKRSYTIQKETLVRNSK